MEITVQISVEVKEPPEIAWESPTYFKAVKDIHSQPKYLKVGHIIGFQLSHPEKYRMEGKIKELSEPTGRFCILEDIICETYHEFDGWRKVFNGASDFGWAIVEEWDNRE